MDAGRSSASTHEERRRHIAERVAHEEKVRRRVALLRRSILHPLVLLTMFVAWRPFHFAPPWPVVNSARFTSEGLRFDGPGMVKLDVPTNPRRSDSDFDVAYFEIAFMPDRGASDDACLLSAGPGDAPSERGILLATGHAAGSKRLGIVPRDDEPRDGDPVHVDAMFILPDDPCILHITLGNDLDGRRPCMGLVTTAVMTIGDRRFDLLDPNTVVLPSWYWSLPANLCPRPHLNRSDMGGLAWPEQLIPILILAGWMTLVFTAVGLAFRAPRAVPLIGFGLGFGVILELGQFVFDGNPDLAMLAVLESGALLGCGLALRVAARLATRDGRRRDRHALP